jgi:transcriptional regulator with XRE-family HTH domain
MADGRTQFPVDAATLAEQLGLTARQFKLYLAQNVTAARRRAGLTQLQLAQAAELSRATVHLIEAGAGDPRLSTITRLAAALNVDALDLLTRAGGEASRATMPQ